MSSSRIYRNGFTETDDNVTTALWNGDTIRKRKLNNDNIERKMVPKIHVEINGEDGESLDCNGPEWQETAHLIKYRQQEDLNISRKTLMTRVFSNETFTGNEKGKILRDDGEASCSSYDREPLLPALSDPEEDDDEFRTKVIDESAKQEEKSFSIALQVLFPFLIAGFGTVSAGLLLDVVQGRQKQGSEEESTTKVLTDVQQNNMQVCDCRLSDSDSITGYLEAVKS